MTKVLYTGDMGMSTMKVCSWCISRLGGSPARATRNTPPRRGCSSARTTGPPPREGLGFRRAYLLLGQPDVLKAAIIPVAGLWRIVADLGRAYLQPVRPQSLDAPDLL